MRARSSKVKIRKIRPIWTAGRPKIRLQPGIRRAKRAMPPAKRERERKMEGRLLVKNLRRAFLKPSFSWAGVGGIEEVYHKI